VRTPWPAAGFDRFTREQWAQRADAAGGDPFASATSAAAAAGEPVTPDEVASVYAPLCRLVETMEELRQAQAGRTGPFRLGGHRPRPLMIGIAGGVAVGKSTAARVVQSLLSRQGGRTVELISTDAFLFPNRVLEAQGLAGRKGFPETYDRGALLAALAAIRSGHHPVTVPVYSHRAYDILDGEVRSIDGPDIVVVEGLTVLQTGTADDPDPRVVSDFIDLAVYIDAEEEDAAAWHTERLLALRAAGGEGPFARWLSSLSDEEAAQLARASWSEINLVNLRRYVAPTARRAHVVLRKDRAHRVEEVLVRLP